MALGDTGNALERPSDVRPVTRADEALSTEQKLLPAGAHGQRTGAAERSRDVDEAVL